MGGHSPPPEAGPAARTGYSPRQAQEDLHELKMILKDCVGIKTNTIHAVFVIIVIFFF